MKVETRLMYNSSIVATQQQNLEPDPSGTTIQYINVTNLLKFQGHHQLTIAIAQLEKMKEQIDIHKNETPAERFNPKPPTGS